MEVGGERTVALDWVSFKFGVTSLPEDAFCVFFGFFGGALDLCWWEEVFGVSFCLVVLGLQGFLEELLVEGAVFFARFAAFAPLRLVSLQ